MALRDDDKMMAGLLRRTLASSSKTGAAAAADVCPPADVLAAYYEHSLSDDETARYDAHFSQCARCRDQLAALVRAEEAPEPKANWAWLWNPYWLAPAFAVLALAIFFGMRHSSQTASTNPPSNGPLVAMSRPDQAQPQESAATPPQLLASPSTAPAKKSEAPAEAGREAPPSNAPKASADSVERDVLSKSKQSQLQGSPGAPGAPPVATEPEPAPNTLSNKKIMDMPLNGRNVAALQPLQKSPTAAKDSASPQSADQSVAVTSAGPLVQADQAASSAGAAPAPSRPSSVLGGTLSAGAAGLAGGGAGVGKSASPPTNAIAESANRGQTQAPPAMSRYAAAAKAPAPQITAEIGAQKIFQTPNTNVLWRSADGGFVERSPDGGATWEGQPLPGTSGEIDAGSSPTPKICWLVGSGGTIFMTKDAINWTKITPPVSADFSAVSAKDASNATVTTSDGRAFQTTDGGKHWRPIP